MKTINVIRKSDLHGHVLLVRQGRKDKIVATINKSNHGTWLVIDTRDWTIRADGWSTYAAARTYAIRTYA